MTIEEFIELFDSFNARAFGDRLKVRLQRIRPRGPLVLPGPFLRSLLDDRRRHYAPKRVGNSIAWDGVEVMVVGYDYLEKDGAIFRRHSILGVTCHPVEDIWNPKDEQWQAYSGDAVWAATWAGPITEKELPVAARPK